MSASTAVQDFANTKIVMLGSTPNVSDMSEIREWFASHFPASKVIVATSDETESAKIFVNSFYASKIQIFNEFYGLCQQENISFQKVRELMLELGWIHPMHTAVPGSDGKLSFGGLCFPKDLSALIAHMERKQTPCSVLRSVLEERNIQRSDNLNILRKGE